MKKNVFSFAHLERSSKQTGHLWMSSVMCRKHRSIAQSKSRFSNVRLLTTANMPFLCTAVHYMKLNSIILFVSCFIKPLKQAPFSMPVRINQYSFLHGPELYFCHCAPRDVLLVRAMERAGSVFLGIQRAEVPNTATKARPVLWVQGNWIYVRSCLILSYSGTSVFL